MSTLRFNQNTRQSPFVCSEECGYNTHYSCNRIVGTCPQCQKGQIIYNSLTYQQIGDWLDYAAKMGKVNRIYGDTRRLKAEYQS